MQYVWQLVNGDKQQQQQFIVTTTVECVMKRTRAKENEMNERKWSVERLQRRQNEATNGFGHFTTNANY